MASKKKHLKYRAAKEKPETPSTKQVSDAESVAEHKKASPEEKKSVGLPKEKVAYTRLTEAEQTIVKKELWHIVAIAVGILAVYFILWLGFHYGGWSEVILRYIPHGQ